MAWIPSAPKLEQLARHPQVAQRDVTGSRAELIEDVTGDAVGAESPEATVQERQNPVAPGHPEQIVPVGIPGKRRLDPLEVVAIEMDSSRV
jgi:hypothetical protein